MPYLSPKRSRHLDQESPVQVLKFLMDQPRKSFQRLGTILQNPVLERTSLPRLSRCRRCVIPPFLLLCNSSIGLSSIFQLVVGRQGNVSPSPKHMTSLTATPF